MANIDQKVPQSTLRVYSNTLGRMCMPLHHQLLLIRIGNTLNMNNEFNVALILTNCKTMPNNKNILEFF